MQSPDTRHALRCFLAVWLAVSGPAALAQARYSADEVKAAFLYNFAGFVTWPPEARAGEGSVIGVMGAEKSNRNYAGTPRPGQAGPCP